MALKSQQIKKLKTLIFNPDTTQQGLQLFETLCSELSDIYAIFEIETCTSFEEISNYIGSKKLGAQIDAVWLLCLLGKHNVSWVVELEELTLTNRGKDRSFPENIRDLVGLHTLDMSWGSYHICKPSQSEEFFVRLASIPNLKELTLFRNLFSRLPASIGLLTHIEKLVLKHNIAVTAGYREIADEIKDIEKLEYGWYNRSIPTEIGNLTNLKYLELKECETQLPQSIGNLHHLETLITDCNLTALDSSIGNLTNLKTLDLSGNKLRGLPPEIGNLTNLKTLNLSGNKLKDLPPEIGNLVCLQTLNLTNNELSNLPMTVAGLSSLQILSLDKNKLTHFPSVLQYLTSLEELTFYSNDITSIPDFVGNLMGEISKSQNYDDYWSETIIEGDLEDELHEIMKTKYLKNQK